MARALGLIGITSAQAAADILGRFAGPSAAAAEIRILIDANPDLAGASAMARSLALAQAGSGLARAGAEVLALADDLAGADAGLVSDAAQRPVLDAIAPSVTAARDAGAQRVGVLSLRPALKLYHEHLAARGLSALFCARESQSRLAAALEGNQGADELVLACADELIGAGAQAIIAGPAKVGRLLEGRTGRVLLIDSTDQLVRRCIDVCLGLTET